MQDSEFRMQTTRRTRGTRWVVPAFCILHSAFLAGCASQQPSDPNIITIAARVGPNSLHPLKANDEGTARVGQLIYESLMDTGDDLRAHPRLAERFETPDPLTYVVYLRHGVKFHDGHELTARDVVYTFSRFLDPAFVSPFKGAFSALQSVTALDDYTVEFRLKTPFAAFPSQLVLQPPVVPAGSGDALRTFPIGTGPYRFVEYAADDHVTLSAFEGYFDGLPNNAGLVLKVVPDDTMRGLELRRGSLDVVVNDLPPDIVHQLRREETLQSTTSPGLDFSYDDCGHPRTMETAFDVPSGLGYELYGEFSDGSSEEIIDTATRAVSPSEAAPCATVEWWFH